MHNGSILEQLSEEERRLLEENHFDMEGFLELRRRFIAGELTQESNRIEGKVEPAAAEELQRLPVRDSDQGRAFEELGRAALKAGQVGALVLNGGMATRFGGVVKGCVEVFDGVSFLGLKLRDARRHGRRTPVLLMNSFATDDATADHLDGHNYFGFDRELLCAFRQNISVRLNEAGEVFEGGNGPNSLYAPGHGDLPSAINRGALQWFLDRGGKYLLMSNVDNVLATLDPLVIGMHIAGQTQGVEMTVETVEKDPGDTGGMPMKVDGHLQVVEAFRLPETVNAESVPVFNTNTFLFNVEALERQPALTWFVVPKQVDGQSAIQFERLAGELSAYLKAQFLVVPRRGEASRFLPIKRPEDLDQNRDYLRMRCAEFF
jgi:UTP--glucose-1-phosphate uridylyltransferase